VLDIEIKKEQLPVIQINFEEMKQALNEKLGEYKGIVVTDESLSLCKTDQKDLSKIKRTIDAYRKDKKKELSVPITEFESQCKQLIGLVEKVEKPIKEGIQVFDDKKREEKKQKALDIIYEAIQEHGLNKKYAAKINVLPKYMNLTTTIKSIKEDVDQRCSMLVAAQEKEEELIQAIKTTIEHENTTINTKLSFEEFQNLINMNFPLPKIIQRINQMAEKIRKAEMPKEEPKEIPKQQAPEPIKDIPVVSKPVETPIPTTKQPEPLYFVTFKIISNVNQTRNLGEYLRDNKYIYEVLDKGSVKE
jgi:hypothetical protein